jgi:hypothetical protein
VSQYCDPTDLPKYLPQTALDTTTPAAQLQACIDASELADSYMRGRYTLPLLAWGADVRMHTAWIACYLLMSGRGYNAGAGADQNMLRRYHASVGDPMVPGSGWFPGIQRQAIHPDVTPTVSPVNDPITGQPQVFTSPQRGWQSVNSRGVPSV